MKLSPRSSKRERGLKILESSFAAVSTHLKLSKVYRRRSSDVLYFILFYESVHQSDFIKSVLCLYKSVLFYFELFSFIFILLLACLLAWVESKISGLTEISGLVSE